MRFWNNVDIKIMVKFEFNVCKEKIVFLNVLLMFWIFIEVGVLEINEKNEFGHILLVDYVQLNIDFN